MHSRLQFGMRENPASDRRHDSRQPLHNLTDGNPAKEGNGPWSVLAAGPSNSSAIPVASNAAPPPAATGGEHSSTATDSTAASPSLSSATTQHEFEPLIGSCDAARLLGNIHVKTLQRYARRGNLPGYQIGGHWYFRASELDSWLRSRLKSNCQPADRVDLVQEKIR
jgi:excisionase family DNA binding protein